MPRESKDDEATEPPEPVVVEEAPVLLPAPKAGAGEIVVTAAVKVGGVEVGVPTVVTDNEEWRALADKGLVHIA